MSKTRKTLVIVLLVLGSVFILLSFFTELQHWSNSVFVAFALSGTLLATTSLVLVMRKPKAE